jgi:hypothetical protein
LTLAIFSWYWVFGVTADNQLGVNPTVFSPLKRAEVRAIHHDGYGSVEKIPNFACKVVDLNCRPHSGYTDQQSTFLAMPVSKSWAVHSRLKSCIVVFCVSGIGQKGGLNVVGSCCISRIWLVDLMMSKCTTAITTLSGKPACVTACRTSHIPLV